MTRNDMRETLMRVGDRIRALSGGRRIAFAFAAGAVSATGFAPLEFFPALLLGYAALVLLIDAAHAGPRPVRRAALLGWAFAFGQFLIGLHWIGYAFLVDPTAHLWQMPFALLALTAGLGLFGALSAGLAARFWQGGATRLLIFGVAVSGSEWLRGHLFTGFPWNLPAYGWGASLAILQSASAVRRLWAVLSDSAAGRIAGRSVLAAPAFHRPPHHGHAVCRAVGVRCHMPGDHPATDVPACPPPAGAA